MNAAPLPSAQNELWEFVSGVIEQAGLELVDLALRGAGARRVLRVDIDRPGPRGIGLDDCKRVSNALGAAIEASELISTRFVLEVSSPGADRPIRTPDDIRRNIGRRVQLQARDDQGVMQTLCGVLVAGEDDALVLEDEDRQSIRVPRDRVVKATQEVSFHG